MTEIPKAYEPKAVEEKWYQFWCDQGCFTANPDSPKPAYAIVIPPPNVTGMLHMGHVLNNTIQDILARKARMDGKEVLWLPGADPRRHRQQAVRAVGGKEPAGPPSPSAVQRVDHQVFCKITGALVV